MQASKLLAELKERHLYRVAVIYGAATWLMQCLIVALIFGFPVVMPMRYPKTSQP